MKRQPAAGVPDITVDANRTALMSAYNQRHILVRRAEQIM